MTFNYDALALVAIPVQSATCAPSANQIVPCDLSGGGFTVHLPAAPPDRTGMEIKIVAQAGSPNTLTVACGGSDVFNVAGGSTSGTMVLLNQAMRLQYSAATAIWYVVSTDSPLSQLDLRYLNQDTTGSAAKLTTARTIDGQSFDGTANITVVAPGTHAATSKTTPVDADEVPLVDSAASNVLKKLTWANLKAAIKTYYDSVSSTMTNKTLTAPTLTTPALGTPASGVLTNCTGLPVAGGGTGAATLTGLVLGNGTSAMTTVTAPSGTVVGTTDSQTLTNKTLTSPTLTTPLLGTPTSGTLTNCTGLPVAGGGTGAATLTGLVVGNGTSAMTTVTAPAGTVVGSSDSQTLTNKTLTNPTINGYVEGVQAFGTLTTTKTIPALSNGTICTATLTNATTCAFTLPSPVAGTSFVLFVYQPGTTGSGLCTFATPSGTLYWPAAGTPVMTQGANLFDIFTFISPDGTNWCGSYSQGY